MILSPKQNKFFHKNSPGVIVDKILPKKKWFQEMFQFIPHFKTIPKRKQAAKQHLVRGELKNSEVCGCITTIRSVITMFTPEICIKKR